MNIISNNDKEKTLIQQKQEEYKMETIRICSNNINATKNDNSKKYKQLSNSNNAIILTMLSSNKENE